MIDVLIVGAGPSGLMMASMLLKHGISFRIIEKKENKTELSKALGIHARTLEIFEKMGLVEQFLKAGNQATAINLYHDGKAFLNLSFEEIKSDYKNVLVLAQSETEGILKNFIEKRGFEIEYQKELIDFAEAEGLVQAKIQNHEGVSELITARYLIGCDGAHSVCRQKLKIDFIGKKYKSLWALCDVKVNWPFSNKEIHVFMSRKGVLAVFCMKENIVRLVSEVNDCERDEVTKNLSLDYFKKVIFERAKSHDWELSSPGWISHFEIHHRIAEKLRLGQVFLIGDAAHIHSPIGGQGMNTGIQDAYNLSWKLAEVIKGHAPLTLLESYSYERNKVIKEIVAMTHAQTQALALKSELFLKLKKLLLPLVMSFVFLRTKIVNLLSQISRNYRGSPFTKDDWPFFQACHIRAGDRFPNFFIEKKGKKLKLSSVLDDSSHHMLLFLGSKSEMITKETLKRYSENLKAYRPIIKCHFLSCLITKSHLDEVSVVSPECYKDLKVSSSAIFLIRPDGYVGFSCGYCDLRKLTSYLDKTYFRKNQ